MVEQQKAATVSSGDGERMVWAGEHRAPFD